MFTQLCNSITHNNDFDSFNQAYNDSPVGLNISQRIKPWFFDKFFPEADVADKKSNIERVNLALFRNFSRVGKNIILIHYGELQEITPDEKNIFAKELKDSFINWSKEQNTTVTRTENPHSSVNIHYKSKDVLYIVSKKIYFWVNKPVILNTKGFDDDNLQTVRYMLKVALKKAQKAIVESCIKENLLFISYPTECIIANVKENLCLISSPIKCYFTSTHHIFDDPSNVRLTLNDIKKFMLEIEVEFDGLCEPIVRFHLVIE